MNDFTHFVLTRYSAVHTGQEPAPEEWLWYRLGFFIEACCASMDSQTNRDFRWLVHLDDRCPDDFRDTMEQLAVTHGFEPIWGHEDYRTSLPRVIAERLTTPYVITTRFDSDDALARDFVEQVQTQFAHQDFLYVDFLRGLQVDRSGAVYRFDSPSNPFMSLIEKQGDEPLRTVWATGHSGVRALGPLREIVGEPMWLMVIHGGNVANETWGKRVPPRLLRERFDIPLAHRESIPRWEYVGEKVRHDAVRWAGRLRTLDTVWGRAAIQRMRGTTDLPALGSEPPLWYRAARSARHAVVKR